MKGLLLKDFYMMKKYCRSALLIVIVFFAAAIFGKTNVFYMMYPVIIAGMIPVTLLSYDARFKWNSYSVAFPYTKKQMVSVKYIIALICIFSVTVIGFTCAAVKSAVVGDGMNELADIAIFLIAAAFVAPSVVLPVIFRFGAEKGRIIYLAVIAAFCAAVGVAVISSPDGIAFDFNEWFFVPVSVAVFAASWALSVKICRFDE